MMLFLPPTIITGASNNLLFLEDFSAGNFTGEGPNEWTQTANSLGTNWTTGHSTDFDPLGDGTGCWGFHGNYSGGSESWEYWQRAALDFDKINTILFDFEMEGFGHHTSNWFSRFQWKMPAGTVFNYDNNYGSQNLEFKVAYNNGATSSDTGQFLNCEIDVSAVTGMQNMELEVRQRGVHFAWRLANMRFLK